tara:strand:+ start:548 stop:700 length:153 start_codon:yes stop_codon:yes gene_type:complete
VILIGLALDLISYGVLTILATIIAYEQKMDLSQYWHYAGSNKMELAKPRI